MNHLYRIERDDPSERKRNLLSTSAEFVGSFVPPDFLIDDLMQRAFIYALTAPTGRGKTAVALCIMLYVALSRKLGRREIDGGRCLFFAGENPTDIKMRWIKTLHDAGLDPDDVPVFWREGSLKLSVPELRAAIEEETKTHGPFVLVIIDTSAAFFEGDDENSNAQMLAHARNMRSYIDLIEGRPTILVTCHPVKSFSEENLLPRGGGAFLAEIDGNFILTKPVGQIVDLYWQGKYRGPDFAPISFIKKEGYAPLLVDSKGRPKKSVTMEPVDQMEVDEAEAAARHRQRLLLTEVEKAPGASMTELARAVGWSFATGEPNKTLVNRTLKQLEGLKLLKRSGNLWTFTKAGRAALKRETDDETVDEENA